MFDLYTAVVLVTLLFLGITIVDVRGNRLITKATKRRAVLLCLLIAGSMLSECAGVLTDGADASLIGLHRAAKLIEFCLAPAIGVGAAFAYGDAKWPRFALALTAAHAVFECVALPFGWVFTVDAQNVYHREALYLVYVAAFVLCTAYGFFCVIRNGKSFQIGFDGMLASTLGMLIVGIGIQFVFSGIRIDYLCIAVGNMLLYNRYYRTMLQVDAVTRLLNRRCYDVHITDMGSRAAILFFDVDKFKAVNDTYGHSTGDLCLKNVAQRLRSVYGRHGLCYRVGGDEFCVILYDGLEELDALNGRFADAIRRMRAEDDRMPGVSMGYAYYDAAASHIQTVIEEADAMLYRSKNRA
ncbi:MAG: GGDEF domain-containing protein [Candidatus Spyradocola sp.]